MKGLNQRLILQLSMFGLCMGLATVFWIPSSIEPFLWLAIFLVCAYLIARQSSGKHFLHGFCVSLANSVWVTSIHIVLFTEYLAHHSEEAAMMATSPLSDSPRLMMLITGPIIGILSGLVLGLFAFIAGKFIKKPEQF